MIDNTIASICHCNIPVVGCKPFRSPCLWHNGKQSRRLEHLKRVNFVFECIWQEPRRQFFLCRVIF